MKCSQPTLSAASESQIHKKYNELRDLITHEKYKNGRYPKEPKHIDWAAMMNGIESLDPTIAKHVVEYQDDQEMNLMLWAFYVKGGPPLKLVESIVKVSSKAVDKQELYGWNCLHYGLCYGSSFDTMKIILSANPKATLEKNNQGRTPLHVGFTHNESISQEMVQLFVESDPEINNIQDKDEYTPLLRAIEKRTSDEVVLSLLENSPLEAVNKKNKDGNNVLHLAIQNGSSIRSLQTILTINPLLTSAKNKNGDTPLHSGIKNNKKISKEVVQWFVEASPETLLEQNNDGKSPLSSAIEKKLSDKLFNDLFLEALSEEAISKFAIQKDNDGNTGLHFAMQSGLPVRVIRCILKSNPEAAESKNKDGDTPLHFGIKNNKNITKEVVQILVEASPKALLEQNDDRKSPLSSAIEKKLSEVVSYMFLEALPEEDISKFAIQEDNDGNTGLHFAMQSGLPVHVIQSIYTSNPQLVFKKNKDGDTPLHFGIKNNEKITKEVVDWFAETYPKALLLKNNEERTPLLSAMEEKVSHEVIFYLFKHAKPSHGGNREVSPIKWGMRLWQANIVMEWFKRLESWEEVKNKPSEFKDHPYVNGYDANVWVKEVTAGTGSGLSLLLNSEIPLLAQIMLSHAWGDDMEQKMQAVNSKIPNKNKVIWFCIYANYQPGDDAGPSVEEQIAMEPFKKVIKMSTLEEMIAVHTTTAELYHRLWCAHEIDEAMSHNVKIRAAFSYAYQKKVFSGDINIKVDTERAQCCFKSDEEYIKNLIQAKEGKFERLNERIEKFREKLFDMKKVEVALPDGDLGIEISGSPATVVSIMDDSPLADQIIVGMVVESLTSFYKDEDKDPWKEKIHDHEEFQREVQFRNGRSFKEECKKCVAGFINPNIIITSDPKKEDDNK